MSQFTQVSVYQISPIVDCEPNSLRMRACFQPRPRFWEEDAAAFLGLLAFNDRYDGDRDQLMSGG